MHKLAALTLVLVFACGAAEARGRGDDYYINKSGHRVHRPMHSNSVPAGASAKCRDGTYSFSEHRRGTCSYHGGVAMWLR